ncbi:MAG: TldD/PmbA family protein [Leptospiraceae bacterium]|nr:TldD/PmbA family protein [Leptospiraceae bacterium]
MKVTEAMDYLSSRLIESGVDQWDLIGSESQSLSLELFERKPKNSEISFSRGIGVRLFRKQKPGYSYTEQFTTASLDQCLADALDHTELTDTLDLNLPDKETLPKFELYDYDPEIEEINFDQLKNFSLEIEDLARNETSDIENIPYLGAGKSTGRMFLRNSKGVDYSRHSGSLSAGIGVLLSRGDSRKMGSYSSGGRKLSALKADKIATTAVERGSGLLGAEPVKSGMYTILLRNRIASQLFSMFSSIFYAESAQKGGSRLNGRLGETIACGALNLISDPFQYDLPGSALFDGEGVVSRKIPVIEFGIFNSFLYNLESANREKVSPTGNGTRGYSGKAGTSFSNLIVTPDNHNFDGLCTSAKKMLVIEKLEGGAGCSAVSGEISIGAQGFLLENGKKVQPVDRIVLSGNFFDWIKNIQMISDSWSESFSSIKVPDLVISGVQVAG